MSCQQFSASSMQHQPSREHSRTEMKYIMDSNDPTSYCEDEVPWIEDDYSAIIELGEMVEELHFTTIQCPAIDGGGFRARIVCVIDGYMIDYVSNFVMESECFAKEYVASLILDAFEEDE
eukprot:732953_1